MQRLEAIIAPTHDVPDTAEVGLATDFVLGLEKPVLGGYP